jgi:WW domain/Cyclin, N-terminal domain
MVSLDDDEPFSGTSHDCGDSWSSIVDNLTLLMSPNSNANIALDAHAHSNDPAGVMYTRTRTDSPMDINDAVWDNRKPTTWSTVSASPTCSSASDETDNEDTFAFPFSRHFPDAVDAAPTMHSASNVHVPLHIAAKWITMADQEEIELVACGFDPTGNLRLGINTTADWPVLQQRQESPEPTKRDESTSTPPVKKLCRFHWLAPRRGTHPKIASGTHVLARLDSSVPVVPLCSSAQSHCHKDSTTITPTCATALHHTTTEYSASMTQTLTGNRDPEGVAFRGKSSLRQTTDESTEFDSDAGDDDDSVLEEDENDAAAMQAQAALWKTAVDPKSGRSYWFHVKTRETQWRKPMCCATSSERRAAARKEQQTREFFASMEANILKSMAASTSAASSSGMDEAKSALSDSDETAVATAATSPSRTPRPLARSMFEMAQSTPHAPLHRPSMLVRTISSMEASVLADLIQRVPSCQAENECLQSNEMNDDDDDEDAGFRPLMNSFRESSSRSTYHSAPSASNLLSPIQEGISPTLTGTSGTTASMTDEASSSCAVSPVSAGGGGGGANVEYALPGMEREISLNLSSLFARQQSESTKSVAAQNSSLHLSAMMRDDESMASFSNSNNRFNLGMASVIPEGENEDESIVSSGSQHLLSQATLQDHSSSSTLPRRLTREVGSLHVASQADEKEHSKREGLSRMHGSLQLEAATLPRSGTASPSRSPRRPVAREESLDLNFLTQARTKDSAISSWSFAKDVSSMALDQNVTGDWGSFWAQSDEPASNRQLTREGESMRELVAITQEMASVELSLSPSSSSSNSLDGLNAFSADDKQQTDHDRKQTQEHSRNFSTDSLEYSDDAFDTSLSTLPRKTPLMPIRRPVISRPMSLRSDAVAPSAVKAAGGNVNISPTMMEKPGMLRRNTCGTLYVGSTMSAPDKDATIKCVCAVYRAHILQSELQPDSEVGGTRDENGYRVFHDLDTLRIGQRVHSPGNQSPPPPSLDDIALFYRDVFGRAQMESDCIIMSLIYVERLIKVTEGALRPRATNWRSILFSCMVLASKVWDDLSMWNADFSQTCPAGVKFSLQRVNALEIAVLSALQYTVKVPASEYAKYYFLLRSMLIKSGLGSEDLSTINPLDVEGAKQLQHVSAQYQVSIAALSDRRHAERGRCKSAGDATTAKGSAEGSHPESNAACVMPGKQRGGKVGLEHMVYK